MAAVPLWQAAEIVTMILAAAQEVLKHLEADGVVVHCEDPHADGELVPDPPHGSISLLLPHRNGREPPNLDPIDSRQEAARPRRCSWCSFSQQSREPAAAAAEPRKQSQQDKPTCVINWAIYTCNSTHQS